MKSLAIKTVPMDDPSQGGAQATYLDLCSLAVRRTPQGGFDFALLARRIRVMEAIEAARAGDGTFLRLEDADAETLNEAVKAMRWGSTAGMMTQEQFQAIHDFCRAVQILTEEGINKRD